MTIMLRSSGIPDTWIDLPDLLPGDRFDIVCPWCDWPEHRARLQGVYRRGVCPVQCTACSRGGLLGYFRRRYAAS